MLLSLCGIERDDKHKYARVHLALATEGEPEVARVFRKLRRVAQSNKNADPLLDRRPDYQDLVLWLKLWVWVNDRAAENSLVTVIKKALDKERCSSITRFGGLSLGESSHLVDAISLVEHCDGKGNFLISDEKGTLDLPVWVDHPCSGKDRCNLRRFGLTSQIDLKGPPEGDARWITIEPPD